MIYIVIILFVLLIFIPTIIATNKADKENLLEKQKQESELLRLEEENKIKKREDLIKQYGALTLDIEYLDYNQMCQKENIYVFEAASIIIINDKPIKFEEIIRYEVKDDATVIYSGQVANTSTDTGSMLGRAVVGGIVGGGVGAIIGGSTANKTTTISEQTGTTEHIYNVIITLNNLSQPLIDIDLGFDNNNALNKIVSVLEIIIQRNKQKNV